MRVLTLSTSFALALASSAAAQLSLTTTFQGGTGQAGNMFDIEVSSPITITDFDVNLSAGSWSLEIYRPIGGGAYLPIVNNAAAWQLVDSFTGIVSTGPNVPTSLGGLTNPIAINPGQREGIYITLSAGGTMWYTNTATTFPTGSLFTSDANLDFYAGAGVAYPFNANFNPRVWNGTIYYTLGGGTLGTNYCGPGVANSTGNPGEISGVGSLVVANNNLTLQASSLPNNAFGYFLTSQTQGMVAQPGGSLGVLCLGGNIGRYTGPGQIQNSGATGSFDLLLDLTQTPTPTGLVAVAPGETWNFQAWHRDSVGGTAVSNFTDGLSATFQ